MIKQFVRTLGLILAVGSAVSAAEFEDFSARSVLVTPQFNGGGPSNQFPRIRGTYNGLIMPTNDVIPEYSGIFWLWVDSDHDYSGRLEIGAETVGFHGRFNSQGQSAVLVYRRIWDE